MKHSNLPNLRNLFLDFFKEHNHIVYDSMPLVPDDASLLFTNAGMVQFKDIFTGKIPIPSTPRATSSQLCIRAGGKHNDLENVGYTARHHTLFEMLGNFSFGNYFKEEAIEYGFEFVTKTLGFDKSLIYITVHDSDDEAFGLWQKFVDSSRIKRMGDKDNFWQMGDSGPCGPCSEIYIDQGDKYFKSSEDYFGGEGDRFLEIWNLVFMQYEQENGKRQPLPKPSIDTGMGLERVVALMEGKINNFDTSIFAPLIGEIESIVGKKYYTDDELFLKSTKELRATQASFRVIADHARSVCFLLAQGVNFDKEGRGYVLRRILRRALRHGYLLGLRDTFLYKIVRAVCDSMGGHYSYLNERKDSILSQCRAEEERFLATIESGMDIFNKELERISSAGIFSGEVAFKLYDTYGFPLDLTQDMLRDKHINIDLESFDKYMNHQKELSRASWKGSGDSTKEGCFKELIESFGINSFVGYEREECESEVLALLDSGFNRVDSLSGEGYVLLKQTPLYPQSGGPIGDRGVLEKHGKTIANVLDTQKYFELNISKIECNATLKCKDKVTCRVDKSRHEIIKHHSATHLLHLALRKILGSHISQAGSLVEPNRLRFDFSHAKPLSDEELTLVQDFVNDEIMKNNTQLCEIMDIENAKSKGAMALFGEKYGDEVRVVSFGDSIELCGGIHVRNSLDIGSFYITKESGVSSGVRRIEAVCGRAAYLYAKELQKDMKKASEILKTKDIITGISKLKERKDKKRVANTSIKGLEGEIVNGVRIIVERVSDGDLKAMVDNAKNEHERVAILLLQESEGKISIVCGVKNVALKANEWIKEVAKVLGGNGGGREDFASAGAKDCSRIDEAMNLALEIARGGEVR